MSEWRITGDGGSAGKTNSEQPPTLFGSAYFKLVTMELSSIFVRSEVKKGNKDWFDIYTMISIEVFNQEGLSHEITVPTDIGLNLMEVCKASDLPVEGICGGMALCASCHVYVLSDHHLETRSHEEEDMLDKAFFVTNRSRLACQIRLSEELDGLKVKLAPV